MLLDVFLEVIGTGVVGFLAFTVSFLGLPATCGAGISRSRRGHGGLNGMIVYYASAMALLGLTIIWRPASFFSSFSVVDGGRDSPSGFALVLTFETS